MSQYIQRPSMTGNGRDAFNAMWQDCPIEEIKRDPGVGYFFEDDFNELHALTGKYTVTQATQGTFLILDKRYGVAELDSNSSTQHQGAQIQAASTVGNRFAPLANTKLWFEADILLKDIGAAAATPPNMFCGLHMIDTTILSSGALVDASDDWIGFKKETAVVTILGSCSNNTTESVTGTLKTITTTDDGDTVSNGSAWMKLGFKVTGTDLIEFWLNGAKVGEITTNIPTALMVPSLVCQSDGTTDPIIWLDRWRCFCEDRTQQYSRTASSM